MTGKPLTVSCATVKDSLDTNPTGASAIGIAVAAKYIAQQFTAGSSYNACRIDLNLQKAGTGQDITVYIYSDNASNDPDASLGDCGTVSAADMNGAAYEWETFTCSTPIALTNATLYWIVAKAGATNASNYVAWGRISTGSNIDTDADAVGPWAAESTTRKSNYKVYGP